MINITKIINMSDDWIYQQHFPAAAGRGGAHFINDVFYILLVKFET